MSHFSLPLSFFKCRNRKVQSTHIPTPPPNIQLLQFFMYRSQRVHVCRFGLLVWWPPVNLLLVFTPCVIPSPGVWAGLQLAVTTAECGRGDAEPVPSVSSRRPTISPFCRWKLLALGHSAGAILSGDCMERHMEKDREAPAVQRKRSMASAPS